MSSNASKIPLTDHAVYCGSKGALDMLTEVMCLELGPHNIRVNSVNPCATMTDMGREHWSEPSVAGPYLKRIPLGRFAEVSDVVSATMFLLSDEASFLSGVFLNVDGGM